MKKISKIVLFTVSAFSIGCANLADNPILLASAAHPNNWIARALVISSAQKKAAQDNEIQLLYKKNTDLLTKEEAIRLAEFAEDGNYHDVALKYWIIAGIKGEPNGFFYAGEINEDSSRIEPAYTCYLLAGYCGINEGYVRAKNLEKDFSNEKLKKMQLEVESLKIELDSANNKLNEK